MNDRAVSALKEIIKRLHSDPSADRAQLARQFQQVAHAVTPLEIATAEQEAIDEGVPLEGVRKLCDVHLDMFTDEAKQTRADLPPGHPIAILYDEHDSLLAQIREARKAFLPEADGSVHDPFALVDTVARTVNAMQAARRYFEKEENALFPVIERYGITRPPAVMWSEHDSLREIFREFERLGPADRERAGELLLAAEETLTAHVHKEETILFKTALAHIQQHEWQAIRVDFDTIGYMHPQVPPAPEDTPAPRLGGPPAGGSRTDGPRIVLPSGHLTAEQLLAVFSTLPVDITVVDEHDEVAFFSETPERIFPRARSVIGRNVRNCHPPKSVHVVEEILRSFRAGERDSEEFYLRLGGKYISIRYYALRSETGKYLGCLEVSQDIAPIQAISGEKRIL